MAPRWIGINGAFATNSPSGAKSAHEKSSRSLIFVLIEVCWSDRPMASATLMKRLAKRVSIMGSAPLLEGFWPMLTLNSVDMLDNEETTCYGLGYFYF